MSDDPFEAYATQVDDLLQEAQESPVPDDVLELYFSSGASVQAAVDTILRDRADPIVTMRAVNRVLLSQAKLLAPQIARRIGMTIEVVAADGEVLATVKARQRRGKNQVNPAKILPLPSTKAHNGVGPARVIKMLMQSDGATLKQLRAELGWTSSPRPAMLADWVRKAGLDVAQLQVYSIARERRWRIVSGVA